MQELVRIRCASYVDNRRCTLPADGHTDHDPGPLQPWERPAGQTFESCPAATGVIETADRRCTHFPDGAHRCAEPRAGHASHRCTDGFSWQSVPGNPTERLRPSGTARFRGGTK